MARRAVVVVAMLAACASAPPPPPTPSNIASLPAGDAQVAGPVPVEVTAFIDRWTTCWHFSGEDANGNAARKQQILDGINRWCPGNAEQLVALRVRYKDRRDVLEALAALDAME